MRPSSYSTDPSAKPNWRVIGSLLPYLLEFRGRVIAAFAFLIAAKVANVAMPWVLKLIVDDLDVTGVQAVVVPVALLLIYGAVRFGSVFLGEMRDAVFARVAERSMRRVGLQVFRHLHRLDLDFHLSRKTGGLSRDIERGTSGISFLMRFLVFNILPTLFEITLVAIILLNEFSWLFMVVILISVCVYVAFSIRVTEWRSKFVREANERDNVSNTRAIDSLLNYETVKYFNNEQFEASQYDQNLADWEKSRIKNRLSLAALNSGQALIIAIAVTAMMLLAAHGVQAGTMTLGGFVMVNAYMLQLFIPLNFLGFVYREIRQALINIERMFDLLRQSPMVADSPEAQPLEYRDGQEYSVKFNRVTFSYQANRPILKDVSFSVAPGQKVAIVGASGAGKSTIAKLLFRFYDITSGSIEVNGRDIRSLTQDSLRRLIGVVPQDTVLFNESIYYNIAYGNPEASTEDVMRAARDAYLDGFIQQLPEKFETLVGERGLKVSGGEKQRIAIARVLLKNPPLLIFDEATSALDTHAEQVIGNALDRMARQHTTIVIAHRLSTIMNADHIVVLDQGRVVEQGKHEQLLDKSGRYADLWHSQSQLDQASDDQSMG